jgi:3-oxoacyl-(acyl-carrier-protein) synthase III
MRAVVTGVGHYVPARVVTSAQAEGIVSDGPGTFRMPAGMIELLTGVGERRHAAEDVASSDLGARAGLAALENAGLQPMAIDLLISSSATHDCAEPATSSIIQDKIGCRNASVMDVKDACAGFLHGLDVAAALIETGRATRVLVTAGEVLSSVINWKVADMDDLQTKFAGLTLGDAGGAFVVEASAADGRGVLKGEFMSDGSHWRLSTVLGGGTLMRQNAAGLYFECHSAELQQLALEHLPGLIEKTMMRIGWSGEDLALAIPHQVSRGVIVELCNRWGFPLDKCLVTLDRFGNTAAASIPLAASLAAAEGRLRQGDKVLLICGAAGFSAGVLPIIW